ncbi:MAG: hypothetical protein ACYTAN_16835, partial [Planctomycetota bacterium]
KLLKDSPPRLRAVGHIEMSGEGASAEIRRDLAHMIDKGHVTGVSIRWDPVPGKSVRRVNLPSDHPYFVDAETEKDPRKRYGLFFEEWRAMEGSVVALGADPQALIGRAEETEGAVSTYWRAMAENTEEPEILEPPSAEFVDAMNAQDQALAQALADKTDREMTADPEDTPLGRATEEHSEEQRELECEEPDPEADAAAALAALRMQLNDCREANTIPSEIINAVWESFTEEEQGGIRIVFPEDEQNETEDLHAQLDEMREKLEAAEQRATAAEAALEDGRVKADPLSAPNPLEAIERFRAEKTPHLQAIYLRQQRGEEFSPLKLVQEMKALIDQDSEEIRAEFRKELDRRRGKVTRDDETE